MNLDNCYSVTSPPSLSPTPKESPWEKERGGENLKLLLSLSSQERETEGEVYNLNGMIANIRKLKFLN